MNLIHCSFRKYAISHSLSWICGQPGFVCLGEVISFTSTWLFILNDFYFGSFSFSQSFYEGFIESVLHFIICLLIFVEWWPESCPTGEVQWCHETDSEIMKMFGIQTAVDYQSGELVCIKHFFQGSLSSIFNDMIPYAILVANFLAKIKPICSIRKSRLLNNLYLISNSCIVARSL